MYDLEIWGPGDDGIIDQGQKQCIICLHSPDQPSSLDNDKKRKWARKHDYGPFCWWCLRGLMIFLAHIGQARSILKHVNQSPEHWLEAAEASYAYMTLREEGNVQVTINMLRARINMLRRCLLQFFG